MTSRRVTVLVIDDSAQNRRAITQLLESAPDVEVIGRASDGEEGLKQAAALRPDVITLDLEMPKLDGFAFLRLLMANVPTPVIVISSYAHKSDVFKALELGAFDFIAKPARGRDGAEAWRAELLEKIRAVRLIRPDPRRRDTPQTLRQSSTGRPLLIAAVGASTGGPPAVQRLLEALPPDASICLLVAQHMPPRFTQAFAERLDRIGPWTVTEARDGDVPAPGRAFIAPGGKHLLLARGRGGRLELQTPSPGKGDHYTPSVDLLFRSVAKSLNDQSVGIVLTGMGADGAQGAKAIHQAGGEVWAESEETAVIFGMPKEAVLTGAVKRILPLHQIPEALAETARKRQ
ncbi:MAG: chemotaxis response regulator protein-glutamate methylesterase [Myxococcaceae bacterium]|nr:chemotaxis response regulator protein-glutamate methylesterase [Myxococcaceae bacterium]